MTVCKTTKDQTQALLLGPDWSLTVEPLWYTLTLEIQVPEFTPIFLFLVPFQRYI